jgi:hypothetical protein
VGLDGVAAVSGKFAHNKHLLSRGFEPLTPEGMYNLPSRPVGARYPINGSDRDRFPSTGLRPWGARGFAFPWRARHISPAESSLVSSPAGETSYDWSFTSCGSPPRLATTQLQSVTSYVDLERTCTSPTQRPLRRTRARLQPCRLKPTHSAGFSPCFLVCQIRGN